MNTTDMGIGASAATRDGMARTGKSGAALLALLTTLACDNASGGRGLGNGGINLPEHESAGDSDDLDDDDGEDGASADDDGPGDPGDDPDEPAADAPGELPFDPGKLAEVCARDNGDRVAQALCNGAQVDSIADLRNVLQFASPFFAMTANSSSLVARGVSAINNPRLVVGDRLPLFGDGPLGDGERLDLLAMGFARGEQFVELVGFDPIADELNFYLLMFEQACNDSDAGCTTADLVTPAVEED